ncbi:MAG TPA: transcription antitermination factor NusB [Polyangiaceae bacterium]|nr:transcription antitermination factor NusB [Polyangiaceae bacterium]
MDKSERALADKSLDKPRPAEPEKRQPSARSIAAKVVERVLTDDAFMAAALDAELRRHPQLDTRERALATELCYGTLRTEPALRARLFVHAPRGVSDERVLAQLLVAAYQILLLDRVPAFAAVDAAVTGVKRERGPRVAGFANAVLRKLCKTGEKLTQAQALREAVPAWLWQELTSSVGEEQALALIAGEAFTGLRLRLGAAEPEWLRELLPGRVSTAARLVRGEGDPRQKPGFAEGAFTVQEEGAQAIGLALGVRAGDKVLDACAGRGQKSTLLAERLAGGRLVACDLYPEKLEALAAEAVRLGLPPLETHAVDWCVGQGGLPDDFDRVLVDAPCSGTGTLRRRPEILRRLGPEDPARLGELSEKILRSAASRARTGGTVLFAVCSVLRQECEDVMARVTDLLEPAPFDAPELPSELVAGKTVLRLLPGLHGTDGYFMACFRRR